MAKAYNIFEGTQTDINRRLLRKIEALEKKQAGDTAKIAELESQVDALETKQAEDAAKIEELESQVAALGTPSSDEPAAG